MKFIHLTPTVVASVQFGVLAVGMASWLGEDEGSGESEGDDEFEMDGDDGFDDDFDDEFGSFDGMDDEGGGGQSASVNELENRIEELETEVSNVSSKANTVRSENEQISESVEDVEENVRKLLEIYEMVTRGVNPFVDDVDPGGMSGGAESFGLFDEDEDESSDGEGDELDADIANADSEDFFEDDAFDDDEFGDFDDGESSDEGDGFDEFDDGGDFDEGDEFDDGGDFDEGDEFDDGGDEEFGDFDDGESSDDDGGDATSFEELKSEYESGEAEWADEDEARGDDAEAGIEAEEKPDIGFDDSDLEAEADAATDQDAESDADADATEEVDVASDDGFDFGDADEAAETTEDAGPDEAAATPPSLGLRTRGDGPHLEEPPTGYLADVVALEWLDYLLSEFGPKNTVRTLNYYQRIGWLGEPARDHLFDYLEGLTDSDYLYREEFGTTELTMDDHLQSLEYIEELAGGDIERSIVDRCENLNRNGLQR